MIIKLYKGEVELDYEDAKHTYTDVKTGLVLNGVTSILKVVDKSDALVPWAVKMDLGYMKVCLLDPEMSGKWTQDKLDDLVDFAKKEHERSRDISAEFGTGVHALIEEYIKGGNPKAEDPLSQARLDNFMATQKDMGFEFVQSERIVMSKEHQYCGTTDALGYYKGEMYVFDIKTNTVKPPSKRSGIYPTYWYQTAAYQHAIQEEDGIELAGRILVRIGEDGVEVGVVAGKEAFDKDFAAFLGAKALYNRNHELSKR